MSPASDDQSSNWIAFPPIPKKLVERIWRNEYAELNKLLPAHLGIPQPTLLDVPSPNSSKPPLKQITSIEEWVMCFNSYVAVIALKQRERVKELLAYSSIIVNSSI